MVMILSNPFFPFVVKRFDDRDEFQRYISIAGEIKDFEIMFVKDVTIKDKVGE